jgi:hypothetical protein
MGNRRRRERLARQARAVPLSGHQGCGCTGVVRLVYRAVCGSCGAFSEGEAVMPSNGAVGDVRDVFASCVCGGEAAGTGRVVEVLG